MPRDRSPLRGRLAFYYTGPLFRLYGAYPHSPRNSCSEFNGGNFDPPMTQSREDYTKTIRQEENDYFVREFPFRDEKRGGRKARQEPFRRIEHHPVQKVKAVRNGS